MKVKHVYNPLSGEMDLINTEESKTNVPKFEEIVDHPEFEVTSGSSPDAGEVVFLATDKIFVWRTERGYFRNWGTVLDYMTAWDGKPIKHRLFECNGQYYVFDGESLVHSTVNIGGSGIELVHGLGDSTEKAMSQAAVTNLYNQGYKLVGTATPSTTPVTLTGDEKVFYIATKEGDYANFGLGAISELSAIKNENGSWIVEGLGFPFSLPKNYVPKALGKNLYDGEVESAPLSSTGELMPGVAGACSRSKNFIPVLPETHYSYTAEGGTWVGAASIYNCFYDKNKEFISSIKASNTVFTTPSDAAFVKLSINNDKLDKKIQLELGDTRTDYEPYNIIAGYLNNIPNNSVSFEAIHDSAFNEEPLESSDKIVRSGGVVTYSERNFVPIGCKNIFNGNLHKGYIRPNGLIQAHDTICYTDYLPVKPLTEYCITNANGGSIATVSFCVAYYRSDKSLISTTEQNKTTYTTPADCYYLRATVYPSLSIDVQIEEGNIRTTYQPYSPIYDYLAPYKPQQVKSLLGSDGCFVSADALAVGDTLELAEFPEFSHSNTAISFQCNFDIGGMGDIYIGHAGSISIFVKIDSNIVSFIGDMGSTSEHVYASFEHGLSISRFLNVGIYIANKGVRIILMTSSGQKIIDSEAYYSFNGTWLVKSSVNLNDVKLSAICGKFRCPVWAFGDSYFGMSVNRVGYNIQNMGFFNLYWSYRSGGHGYHLLPDFKKALHFGVPKYVVWCLGMNEADSTSYDSWLQSVQELISICEEKGITPILYTTPSVPDRIHVQKNEWIKNSGYRYIDGEKAVGADSEGNWYEGMLSTDNVHPSTLGAQAIAMQWLVDFPEIMEYGFNGKL